MPERAAISVIIPTLNAGSRLAMALDALVPATVSGLVKEVIVVDGGSTDETVTLADGFGARVITAPPGRGGQLRKGAEAARGDWLLFLHADTVLDDGWVDEASACINDTPDRAAVFTLQFDARGIAPRLVAAGAMLRTKLLKHPYGDQGLLISRRLYDDIGGYADMPLMEDVELMQRLTKNAGRGVLRILSAKAVTSAEKYERDGYARRVLSNLIILTRFHLGASAEKLQAAYR